MERPLQVMVEPYVGGLGAVPAQVVATVTLRAPDAVNLNRPEVFEVVYGLTKAEARLAALLAEGLDLTAAAERNGVTRETVRSQLKALFQKTGTKRQAELVRMLSGIPAPQSHRPT